MFASSAYFVALPSGVISSLNVTLAAAAPNSAPSSSMGPLGISYLAWGGIACSLVVIAVVLLFLLSRRGKAGHHTAATVSRLGPSPAPQAAKGRKRPPLCSCLALVLPPAGAVRRRGLCE